MRRLAVILLAAGLFASACGDGGSVDGAPEPSPEPGTSPTTAGDRPDPETTEGLAPSPGVERAPVASDAPVGQLVDGINGAGFGLWTRQEGAANLVFSPLSIGHALLMARAAADEATGAAIDAAFGLPAGAPDDQAAHEAWNALDAALVGAAGVAEALDGTPSPIVELADRIWPATTAEPDQEWIDLLARYHGADVRTIDVTEPEAGREEINAWVADRTNQLIPELLPRGFIEPDTVLVLTDAVYFKAQWRQVFGKYGPEDGPFTLLDGSTVDVSYLVERELPGPRGRGDAYVGAEVPYLGDGYSMLLIVPDEGRFAEVRDRLATGLLDEIDATFTPGPFELRMPEWETTTAIDLLAWLTDIGAAPGRYPGIGPEAFLDAAVHGADISVDELGTEAAAATGLGFAESGPPEPELVVAAERPFLYLVRHVDTGAVLFAGQVADPTS
jgi:serpin B